MVCFSTRMSEGLLWRKTICEVVLWSGFVWSFFSQGATCNIMSSEFSLCQVAGVNVRATVHFWDWYVLVKKILPQLPEILPQLTQGKWFVLGTWFLTQTATRLNTFQSCWNKFTSDQKCLSVYEVYEALIFKYQDSQFPNGRLPVAKRWPWSTTPVLLVLQSTTPVLLCTTKYYSSTTPVLLCTTKYYSSTTLYYKVLRQYYSVLQSTTPVLLCTTEYYSVLHSTTPVLLCTTKYYASTTCTTTYYSSTTLYYQVLRQYYSVLQSTTPVKVLLQSYSVLQSTTPVLLCTTLYYKVPLCTTKYYASPTLYYASTTTYYSGTTLYYASTTTYYSGTTLKRHLQCAAQQESPSNFTKYCACHAKWMSSMICGTYEMSFPMRGASKVTLQHHQILRLPRKMNVINDLRDIWNLISNAWSQ